MIKLSIFVVLGIACVTGCTNQSTAPEPKTPSSEVDMDSNDREESVDSAASASDADPAKSAVDRSDADEGTSDTGKSEESKPLGGVKSSPAKQSCKEHKKKSDCEVAMGCAWSTDKVCVDQ